MRIVFKSTWVKMCDIEDGKGLEHGDTMEVQGKTLSYDSVHQAWLIPEGEYTATAIKNPWDEDAPCVRINGSRAAAAPNYLIQFTGEAREEREVIVYDDQGNKMLMADEPEMTWEEVGRRITSGQITNRGIIARYSQVMKERRQA